VIVRKPIVLALSVVVVGVAALAFFSWPSGAKGDALAAREAAMAMLGARIAKVRPGCPVLVLANPFAKDAGYLSEKNQFERAGLHGLRHGLGRRGTVTVVSPEIRPEYFADPASVIIPPDSTTPLSFLMRPASVSQLADAHPECPVIVSLIGLPFGVERLPLWSEEDPRNFALLLPDLRVLGPPAVAAEAFERGKILAAVVTEGRSGQPLVVTGENAREVLQSHPKLLGYGTRIE
jgi:hypothetical protein